MTVLVLAIIVTGLATKEGRTNEVTPRQHDTSGVSQGYAAALGVSAEGAGRGGAIEQAVAGAAYIRARDEPVDAVPTPEALDPDPQRIEELVCSYGWDCATALRVFTCESRLDPAAVDATGENWGLTQLNRATWEPHFGPERWALVLDAGVNLEMAWEVYERGGGWFPWACY